MVLFAAEFLLPGFSHKPGADTGSSSVFKEGVERCNHGTQHKLSSPMLCSVLLMVKCCGLSLLDWLHTHTHAYSFSSETSNKIYRQQKDWIRNRVKKLHTPVLNKYMNEWITDNINNLVYSNQNVLKHPEKSAWHTKNLHFPFQNIFQAPRQVLLWMCLPVLQVAVCLGCFKHRRRQPAYGKDIERALIKSKGKWEGRGRRSLIGCWL